MIAFLSLGSTTKAASAEAVVPPRDKHARLSAVLLSAVTYEESVEAEVKERLVTDLAVVAHHEYVCEFFRTVILTAVAMLTFIWIGGPMRQTWIDICQRANTDPKELIEKHIDKLFKLVLESAAVDAKV